MQEAETPIDIDAILLALADPTRRAILDRLSLGPARVTDIARPFSISLNSVSKHIRILERANLVARFRTGREHVLALNLLPLSQVRTWMAEREAVLAGRLAALDVALGAADSVR